MKKNKKKFYAPPAVEILRVALEGVITASPIQKVNVQDWSYEGPEDDPANNADVWLDI